MKLKVSYAHCSLSVTGLDMNCPLCGVLVKSGEIHFCSRPDVEQKALPRKRRTRTLKGKL